jgi:hypothetical protein
VGGINLEFQYTRTNTQLLRELARRTGGRSILVSEIDSLPGFLNQLPDFRAREVRHFESLELWNWPILLGALILLLAAEWILRRKSGML